MSVVIKEAEIVFLFISEELTKTDNQFISIQLLWINFCKRHALVIIKTQDVHKFNKKNVSQTNISEYKSVLFSMLVQLSVKCDRYFQCLFNQVFYPINISFSGKMYKIWFVRLSALFACAFAAQFVDCGHKDGWNLSIFNYKCCYHQLCFLV